MSWLAQLVNLTGPSSVFGRAGHVIPLPGDYAASQVSTDSDGVPWSDVAGAIDTLNATAANTELHSLHGRTGAVNSEPGDYTASQVDNDSTAPGATVADAVDALHAKLGRVEASILLTDKGGVSFYNDELQAGGFSDASLVFISTADATVRVRGLPMGSDLPRVRRKTMVNQGPAHYLMLYHNFVGSGNIRVPGGTLTLQPGQRVEAYCTDDGVWYLQP